MALNKSCGRAGAWIITLLLAMVLVACGAEEDGTGSGADTGEVTSPDSSDGTGTVEGGGPGVGNGSGGVQSGTLTAGDIDDNLNYETFRDRISLLQQADTNGTLPTVNLTQRLAIAVVNDSNDPISGAQIVVMDESDHLLFQGQANSFGLLYLFPAIDFGTDTALTQVVVRATDPMDQHISHSESVPLTQDQLTLVLSGSDRHLPEQLQWLFAIDTTGSMGDELAYLTVEFDAIIGQIQTQHPDTPITFGLVAYKDVGDSYLVKDFPFTVSIDTMKAQLQSLSAAGGGDYPEAMDQAMMHALDFQWSEGGNHEVVRVMSLVADAPPHNHNVQNTFDAALQARAEHIVVMPLAASGVGDLAENLMRIMAVVTQGSYLFLTDDSGVGNGHAEPSIPCYIVTRLDQLIVRRIDSLLSGQRVEPTANEIIRTSGAYDAGVCGVSAEATRGDRDE